MNNCNVTENGRVNVRSSQLWLRTEYMKRLLPREKIVYNIPRWTNCPCICFWSRLYPGHLNILKKFSSFLTQSYHANFFKIVSWLWRKGTVETQKWITTRLINKFVITKASFHCKLVVIEKSSFGNLVERRRFRQDGSCSRSIDECQSHSFNSDA